MAAATLVRRDLRRMGSRHLPRRPRPRTRANPAGLTDRQLEVLALLAEGLTNAEIAAACPAATLIELGSGTSRKTRMLLDALLAELSRERN